MDYIITIFIIVVLYHFVEYTNRPKRTKKQYHKESSEPIFDSTLYPDLPTEPIEEFRIGNQFMSAQDKAIYLKSAHWYKLRKQRMTIANHTCEVPGCGSKHNLSCHHITYLDLGAEDLSDIRIVCQDHHQQIHDKLGYDRTTLYPLSCLK